MSDEKVVSIGKAPTRVTPEMNIRWLMSVMDQVQDLIVVAKMKGGAPIVAVTTDSSPYLMAMASALLHDLALDGMEPSTGEVPPKSRA